MWKVFLSSTSLDLAKHRDAVVRAIRKLDDFYCQPMEDFGARAQQALEYCRSAVQDCDIFVGILGNFYGSCPPSSALSYTEHEYEAALATGMPLLMFLAPESFPLPAEFEPSPEDRDCQRLFRARVQHASIRDTFGDANELAAAVTAALVNHALKQAQRRVDWRRHEQPGANDRGLLVTKMCNRAVQEEQFLQFYNHHAQKNSGWPLVVFVRGRERERLDSLVARFCGTVLRRHAERLGGVQQGAVNELPMIEWPVHDVAEIRHRALLERLFEVYECADVPAEIVNAARKLILLAQARRYPSVALQFHIQLRRWNAAARDCLERFLGFWDAVGRALVEGAKPQFVIFIHLAYPELHGWRRWFRWLVFRPQRIEHQVKSLLRRRQSADEKEAPSCPALLLSELTPIEPHDVLNWFKRHRIFGDNMKIWQRRCDAIFGKSLALPMMDVEDALLGIYEEHLTQRVRA